ncbi:MAG: hypothetical protein JSS82_10105 [Bacteroidetes bacterium]|nr:hypothetical protein [Bacteroidota bacterium]
MDEIKIRFKDVFPHDLIIDVPNVGQDILSSLKVKYPSSVKGKTFHNMNDISKLADSIYDSFRVSTKKVRIFCMPQLLGQLNRLDMLLDEVIKENFDEIDS